MVSDYRRSCVCLCISVCLCVAYTRVIILWYFGQSSIFLIGNINLTFIYANTRNRRRQKFTFLQQSLSIQPTVFISDEIFGGFTENDLIGTQICFRPRATTLFSFGKFFDNFSIVLAGSRWRRKKNWLQNVVGPRPIWYTFSLILNLSRK